MAKIRNAHMVCYVNANQELSATGVIRNGETATKYAHVRMRRAVLLRLRASAAATRAAARGPNAFTVGAGNTRQALNQQQSRMAALCYSYKPKQKSSSAAWRASEICARAAAAARGQRHPVGGRKRARRQAKPPHTSGGGSHHGNGWCCRPPYSVRTDDMRAASAYKIPCAR